MSTQHGTPNRVLVVDDEPNIVDVVSMALRYQGFEVESAGTGQEALTAVERFRPQLMVLDVMLPDMEGFEVAERLGAQRGSVPIIFLTARDATEDKLRGLTTGGDDYVTKPFSLEELVARIRVILRRSGAAAPDSSRLLFEDLELDEDTREVTRAGEPVELTATEYRLLRYLLLNPRRVLTRAQILDHVWEYDFGGDARVLETYISYLRKKLDAHGPSLIHTARGVGYALRHAEALTMSLRARLVATLLAVAAAGLLVLAARHVRHAEGLPAGPHRRADRGGAAGARARARRPGARFPGAPLRRGGPFGDRGRGGPRRAGGQPAARHLRRAARRSRARRSAPPVVLGYTAADRRGARTCPGSSLQGELTTVGSQDGGGVDFRVRASESPGGSA